MKREQPRPHAQEFSCVQDRILEIDGITYRLHIFVPKQGDRDLAARLKRLMEQAARS